MSFLHTGLLCFVDLQSFDISETETRVREKKMAVILDHKCYSDMLPKHKPILAQHTLQPLTELTLHKIIHDSRVHSDTLYKSQSLIFCACDALCYPIIILK